MLTATQIFYWWQLQFTSHSNGAICWFFFNCRSELHCHLSCKLNIASSKYNFKCNKYNDSSYNIVMAWMLVSVYLNWNFIRPISENTMRSRVEAEQSAMFSVHRIKMSHISLLHLAKWIEVFDICVRCVLSWLAIYANKNMLSIWCVHSH